MKAAVTLVLAGVTSFGAAQGLPSNPVPQSPGSQTGAAQAAPAKGGQTGGQAPAPAATPLQLGSLDSVTVADPFPAVDPKNFTADSPTVATVDSYLRAMVGYDPKRIWRVVAIQKTQVAGISKVTALITEKTTGAKMLTASFYVLPDGKHLIAMDASGMNPFGAKPFAENRALLQAKADGPFRGSASKDLLMVEFADFQCPHCKDAEAIMTKLAQDFPKARIAYESYPLVQIHPFAFQAAAYGACVAKQSSAAFFTFSSAVYATQAGLTATDAVTTLNAAVTKAGLDPAAIAACAATDQAKAQVDASSKLAADLGIESTPMLLVNGRMLPMLQIPYETLKLLISYQASLDGVGAAAESTDGPVVIK